MKYVLRRWMLEAKSITRKMTNATLLNNKHVIWDPNARDGQSSFSQHAWLRWSSRSLSFSTFEKALSKQQISVNQQKTRENWMLDWVQFKITSIMVLNLNSERPRVSCMSPSSLKRIFLLLTNERTSIWHRPSEQLSVSAYLFRRHGDHDDLTSTSGINIRNACSPASSDVGKFGLRRSN